MTTRSPDNMRNADMPKLRQPGCVGHHVRSVPSARRADL